MYSVGIVGAEGAKFTPLGEQRARELIRHLLIEENADVMVSGGCHLGGIDIWAELEADSLHVEKHIYLPRVHRWEGGYKQRNIQIAEDSDIVHCIAVDGLPSNYKGMTFSTCYHHDDESNVPYHIKSGGCWTTKYARKHGVPGILHVVSNR